MVGSRAVAGLLGDMGRLGLASDQGGTPAGLGLGKWSFGPDWPLLRDSAQKLFNGKQRVPVDHTSGAQCC